jgi:hypothetical protein
MACIDRSYHSSANVHIRRMSSLKTARIAIGVIITAISVLHIHMIVYYEISNTSDRFGNIVPACNGQKGIYRTFLGFWHMVLYSLGPSFLMLFFGVLHSNDQRN